MAGIQAGSAGRLSIEIVAEVARLQADLDKCKRAVNAASKDIAKSAQYANDNLGKMGSGINNVGVSSKQAAFGMRNLAFQAQDLGVQFAMAANSADPLKGVLMALVMQGPQIKDAMNQAGLSVGGLGKHIGAMALRWAPAIAAMALATGGLKIFSDEVDKSAKASVSMGDVVLGTFDAIASHLNEKFGPAFKWAADIAGKAWEFIAESAKKSVNFVIGATAVIPKVIAAVLSKIPAAFGDAFYSAANLAIKGVNWLIQKASSAVNGLVDTFNAVFGTSIAKVMVGSLDEIANPFAGGMAAAGKAGAEAFVGAFKRDYVGEFAKFVSPFADKRAAKRLEKDGKDAGGKAGKAAGKAFVDEFAKMLDGLRLDVERAFADIDKRTRDILDKQRDADSKELEDEVERIRAVRKAADDEAARVAEENRQRALDTAHEIADIIGGGIGDLIAELSDALIPLLDITKGLGKALEAFGKGARLGSAVGGLAGSSAGGGLGGGLGQVLGEEFLTKGLDTVFKGLGKFAGPLGAIAGGLLGGIIGGMLKKTPRASATVSIIAGEAMETAIQGSSSQLKKIAGEMATGLLSGLDDIAASLGAQLVGDASVSVGIRKKNYRVDPTGSGITKTSKGAIDFGEDKAAAIAFALQDAIKDGVLGGLSASLEKLITGDGDLQTQLQKALNFKGVFDDLAQRANPQQFDLDQIDKWRAGLDKIFAEAGATADELAKLEELTGIKRTEIVDKYAQEAVDKQRKAMELQIQILELEGKQAEAVALARQLEMQGLTETEKALQIRAYQLQDEADRLAKLAAIEAERQGLMTQLLQMDGNVQALREQELATLDPVNRILQQTIYLRQDEAAAAEAAARKLEEAAAKAQAIANERYGLETQLLQLNGNTAALRARELATLDPSNKALMRLIYARQDEIAAADAAAKAAEELAARQKAIADEAFGLQTQWLQAIGDEAALRARALAQLDPSNRALQQQIWAYEDAQKAAQAEIAARNDQIAAIQDTASALQAAQSQWTDMAKTIREFRAGLFAPSGGSGISLANARGDFDRTSRMASLGDMKSLQSFTGVSQTFLDAARENATSLVDYQRAIGLVAGAADAAAAGAEEIGRQTADQYAALMAQIVELQTLNTATTASVESLASVDDVQQNDVVPTLETVVVELRAAADQAEKTRADEQAENRAIIANLSEQNSYFRQIIEAGMLRVLVMNETTDPVPTLEVTP